MFIMYKSVVWKTRMTGTDDGRLICGRPRETEMQRERCIYTNLKLHCSAVAVLNGPSFPGLSGQSFHLDQSPGHESLKDTNMYKSVVWKTKMTEPMMEG